jgi:WS/DGAT/MGAT family acyltransferase
VTRDELTPLDATFLELEDQDDGATMHIGAALVFDPLPQTGAAPSLDELRTSFDDRLAGVPRFRRRLSKPHTGGLQHPAWENDDQFDLTTHVHSARLPAPGGNAELDAWLSDFWSHRLDRTRPLWETVLVDGLAGGRWMIATKTHHAMVDGVGSVDLGYTLLDTTPERPREPRRPRTPAGNETSDEADRPLLPAWFPPLLAVRGLRAGAGLLVHPSRVRALASGAAATGEMVWRDEVNAAAPSSLNVPTGPTRRYATAPFDLNEVKAIKGALGGTVNDVVLATATTALRTLLIERGDELDRPLRAMVPMNVRTEGDQAGAGNRVTSLFVELPVHEPDARRRYDLACDAAERLKAGSAARGGMGLLAVTDQLPPVFHRPVAKMLFAPRLFNLTITNVPGPQIPLYALGARLREIRPYVPLFAEHSLGLAIVSYDGQLFFGTSADAAVRDTALFQRALRDAYEELRGLAGLTRPRRRKAAAR